MLLSTYVKFQQKIQEFKNDERGVTAIEYAVIGVAIAAIVAAMFTTDGTSGLSGALQGAVSKITTSINGG